MTHYQFLGCSEWKPENTVLLTSSIRSQWPVLCHTDKCCCCFKAKIFLLLGAVKPPIFVGKHSKMKKDAQVHDSGA